MSRWSARVTTITLEGVYAWPVVSPDAYSGADWIAHCEGVGGECLRRHG